MNLKKYQIPLMIQVRKSRSLKKPMEKRPLQKAGKKVKKTPQPKKAPNPPEFVDTDSDDSDDEQEPVVEQLQKA